MIMRNLVQTESTHWCETVPEKSVAEREGWVSLL